MNPVDEYLKIQREIDELTARQKKIAEELLKVHQPGSVIVGDTGKLRVQQNMNVDPELLQDAVSTSVWTRITERKLVAAYITAEVKRGKISQETLDQCKKPGKPFVKKV